MFEEFMWHLLKNEVVGCRCGVQSVALFVLFEQTRAGQWPLPRSFPGSSLFIQLSQPEMLSPWPTDFDVLAQQKRYRNMDIHGLWMAKHGLDREHSATLSWIQSGSSQNGGPCSSPQIHQLHFCLSKKKATLSFVLWGSRTSAYVFEPCKRLYMVV